MENQTRDFKGVWIPVGVYLDERLNALDKIILMEIDSLDTGENGCYASNEYIAEFCQCKPTKVSITINKLIKLGYLEVVKFDGRKRYLRSSLSKNERQPFTKQKADFHKMKDNNTSLLIKDSKKEKDKKEKVFKKPTLEEVREYCEERKNKIDPQGFIDFYESKGWYVFKSKKDEFAYRMKEKMKGGK